VNSLIRVLVAGVLLLGAAQIAVPRVVGAELATALRSATGPGSTDSVAVGAVPFFELFQGRFQSLDWRATHVRAEGLHVALVTASWTNGAVSVPALVNDHELVILRRGQLEATVRVGETALARFLDASGRIRNGTVTVGPSSVRLQGTVLIGGLAGPVDATGRLAVSSDERQILFQPLSIDGFGLPFRTTLVIFDVRTLKLPLPVRLTGIRLESPYVVVTARSV